LKKIRELGHILELDPELLKPLKVVGSNADSDLKKSQDAFIEAWNKEASVGVSSETAAAAAPKKQNISER